MKEEGYQVISKDFHTAYRVLYLIRAFIKKTLRSKEREELDAWLEESDKNIELFEDLTDEANIDDTLALYEEMREEDALRRIKNRIPFVQPKHRQHPIRFIVSVAAILILLIGVGGFFYFQLSKQNEVVAVNKKPINRAAAEVLPAGNKATLTLEDGRQIVLDSAKNGNLVIEHNRQVMKNEGKLSYQNQSEGLIQESAIHTLTIPKGGQYQLTLSDGSKVWLNAASTLKYPSVFVGNERVVELTGEGYFEVRHSEKPFKVKVDNYIVEDLGTSFNINSYKDEGFNKTALVEGSIRIINGSTSKVLIPGQEAIIINNKIQISQTDVDAVKGWMNGKFIYRFTPMRSVLKDLERWYNIEVVAKGINKNHLKATIDRNVSLAQMIRILEGTGEIKLNWDGAKLNALPQE